MWWHGADYTTTKQAVAVAANKSVGVAANYDRLVGLQVATKQAHVQTSQWRLCVTPSKHSTSAAPN